MVGQGGHAEPGYVPGRTRIKRTRSRAVERWPDVETAKVVRNDNNIGRWKDVEGLIDVFPCRFNDSLVSRENIRGRNDAAIGPQAHKQLLKRFILRISELVE